MSSIAGRTLMSYPSKTTKLGVEAWHQFLAPTCRPDQTELSLRYWSVVFAIAQNPCTWDGSAENEKLSNVTEIELLIDRRNSPQDRTRECIIAASFERAGQQDRIDLVYTLANGHCMPQYHYVCINKGSAFTKTDHKTLILWCEHLQ